MANLTLYNMFYEIFTFLSGYLFGKSNSDVLDEDEKNENVCLLKNALLTYILLKYKKEDFDNNKLPLPAGPALDIALTTYLIPKRIDRKTPFYTKIMEEKGNKIRKYLCEEFSNPEKVYDFISYFLDKEKENMMREKKE